MQAHLDQLAKEMVELAATKERLALAVEATGLAVWDWDVSTGLLEFQPEVSSLLGYYKGSRALYQQGRDLTHPDDLPAFDAAFEAHGGAFVGGAASLYRLDRLAREADAVVVSINYRLGVFGFLAPPTDASGAGHVLGLEDQRLAMRWVKANIAAFGGDPENITLAGESAGAASVCMHLMAPEKTRGLFHRAIIQSGSCATSLRTLPQAERFAAKVAKEAGCTDPNTALACLKSIEPQRLIAAGAKAASGELIAFAPFTGSGSVPRPTLDALQAGDFLRVPVLNGFTRDEMRLYVGYDVQSGAKVTPETYSAAVRAIYGDKCSRATQSNPANARPKPSAR
jgi:para-nitrobenzyl esterase